MLFILSIVSTVLSQETRDSVVENAQLSRMLFLRHDPIRMSMSGSGRASTMMVVVEAIVLLMLVAVIALVSYRFIKKYFNAGLYKLGSLRPSGPLLNDYASYHDETELYDYVGDHDESDRWDEESNSHFGDF